MRTITLVHTISLMNLFKGFRSLALSPDGRFLAIGGYYGEVYVWALDSLEQPVKLPYPAEEYGSVTSVTFDRHSALLASVTDEGTLNIWDMVHHQPYAPWQPLYQAYIGDGVLRKYHHVSALLFHQDGIRLFGGGSGGVYCWDTCSGQEVTYLPAPDEFILALALEHSGHWLAGAGWRNHVCFWDLVSGQIAQIISPETCRVDAVSFSPNGTMLLSGGSGSDGGIQEDRPSKNLHVWSSKSLQPLRTLQTPSRWVASMAWHPNHSILATGASYATVTLWDSTVWEVLHILRSTCHFMKWVCFHPIKPWLLCAGETSNHQDYRLEIWQYEA